MKFTTTLAATAFAFGLTLVAPAHSAPTLVENVHGYTLVGDRLQQFTGLVFDLGKVVQTGDAAALHKRFPGAQVVDGGGRTLLPGLIDSHGHVLELGFENVQVGLGDTEGPVPLYETPSDLFAGAPQRSRAGQCFALAQADRGLVGDRDNGIVAEVAGVDS